MGYNYSNPSKSIWASKTVIVAILQGIIGVLVAIYTEYPGLGGILVVKSALDIILRWVTTQPLR